MIVFLTLCYVAVLALLVKIGVIRLNTFWKISPLIWVAILLIVLFIPMQWGAPSGAVRLYQTVVEVVPNVSGEVTEVPAQPLVLMKQGDILFRIDPAPYQYAVDAKRAALAESEQAVEQLRASLLAASASVAEATAVRDQAKQEYERYAAADVSDVRPYSELDVENRRLSYVASEASLERALASELQARLAVQSEIDGVNTTVARLRAELLRAEYDLAQTVVRAPSDGYVLGLTLRPGQRVSNLPTRSWIAYVNSETSKIIAGIPQNLLRHVQEGQSAEVVLDIRPGRTFPATVVGIAQVTTSGQLQASGLLPSAPTRTQEAEPFGVVLTIDQDALQGVPLLPGGAVGTAAIYTESARATHLIRRVMLRMETWLNYLW